MPEYCEVALPVPANHPFTYSVPEGLLPQPGARAIVPFGHRKLIGVVLRCTDEAPALDPAAVKPLCSLLDPSSLLSGELLSLSRWLADYYQVPQGEVLPSFFPRPASLRRKTRIVLTPAGSQLLASPLPSLSQEERKLLERIGKRGALSRNSLRATLPLVDSLRRKQLIAFQRDLEPARSSVSSLLPSSSPSTNEPHRVLTASQSRALNHIQEQICASRFGVFLLHGVTGSGKTEVYLQAIRHALAQGRSALVLVPEISLTPAMARVFVQRFGSRVAVLHSGLTDADREAQWHRIHQGAADVLLGTRSAVFAPLRRPGLFVIDEEHDSSYKQEETPRYHARDVAIIRARACSATVILGSATPSVESRHHAETGKYRLLELESRVLDRPLPHTEIVDMRQEFAETGRPSFLSRAMLQAIASRLQDRDQVLILLNRRGYSAFVLCRKCGKTIECSHCSIALTHHRRLRRLLCHYCGFARPVPAVCPQCSSEHLFFVGEGSERVEDALHRHFPNARIGRLDRDTARGRGRLQSILSAFQHHDLDILVGTQMIAKGHDVHRVTLVGVVSADIGLSRPDFRAAERTFQLLTQVAGRAGRGERPGQVLIQTYYPDHYAVRAAAAQNYVQFYRQELRFRQLMYYPPFSVLANLLIRHSSPEKALQLTTRLGRHLENLGAKDCRILGPAAAPIHRLKRMYRYHFLIKASRRAVLHEILRSCFDFAGREKFPSGSFVMDVDPQSFS